MDPLTALGLASNILSFVSFASGLVKGTLEISASSSGCPIDVTRLDSVCQQLEALCDGLQACAEYRIPQAPHRYSGVEEAVAKTFDAIRVLCTTCKTDADELLRITKTLQTKDGSSGKWESFRIALKRAWRKSSIEELDSRLSRTQITMTLHICTLVNYSSRVQSRELERLQQRSLLLQADQAQAIERISHGINDLEKTVRAGLDKRSSRIQRGHFTADDVESLQEKLQSLSLSQLDVRKQQNIMESLTFESRQMRHRRIQTAHEKTFQWALMTDQDSAHGSHIGNWLRNGNGIFWVSGKPGSGKSTLMKYIGDSSITMRLVDEWARPCRVAVVSHYFWIAGTSMQKSQQGLLQTLLYDIFRQCPDLIEHTCGQRWESTESADSWSLAELHEALQTVVARHHDGLKLCFVIDGLDEYGGDHEDHTQLCRTFKALATSPNVKLCLSSRPWNVFEEQFGLTCPKLYMQDLTRGDIQNYASNQLREHPRWATVSAKHSQGQWLISEIVSKSSGVFLWVVLVIKLLRQGLTNRDAFVDLRRRLESFPSELEPFFKSMLEAVEPFYHSHMSTTLQIANASTESHLSFLIYYFHLQEYEDRDYAVNHPIRPMDDAEIEEIRSNTSWHLDSRTRGLLEINPEDGNVAFLHRTVRDFLETREMHDFLADKPDDSLEFCPMLSILKANIAMIKTASLPKRIRRKGFGEFETDSESRGKCHHTFVGLVEQAMRCASDLDCNTKSDVRYHSLLDELERTLFCMFSENNCTLPSGSWSKAKHAFFREQLVQFQVFNYLHRKLNYESTFLKAVGSLPVRRFFSTSNPANKYFRIHRGTGTDVLVFLLETQGMDPNKFEQYQSDTPWHQVLELICNWWLSQRQSATRLLSFLLEERILDLFLKAGADPSALLIGSTSMSGTFGTRPAAAVYLQFCFDVLDHSPSIQQLYLDVLSEFLRLSNDGVLQDATDVFCNILSNKKKDELHWDLPFFAKVANMLRLSLRARELGGAESLRSLDQIGRRVFPLSLYTPINVAKEEARGRKRKQGSSSGRRRKNKRGARD